MAISSSLDAFVDNDEICSHKGGLSSMDIPYHFPATKVGHTDERVN